MSGVAVRVARAIRLEDVDGIRTAVVLCPWCLAEHDHVVPLDVVMGARLERSPKCDARKGVYTLELPEEAKA